MSLSLAQFRSRFPILGRRVYVNSCSQGALSVDVEQAVQAYLASWHEDGSPWDTWVDVYEALRTEFAAFMGVSADEVAIMPSASCALGAIATALSFDERPMVVMGRFEFPTTAHAWLAEGVRGARVRWVEPAGGALPAGAYATAIDERTRIVPITHVCFRNGHRLDVQGVAALCRERGAYCLVDDYQSTGTSALRVRDLGVDFLVTGALKYLLGPSGIAFLYVRRDLVERLEPLVTGWFGRRNPFAFSIDTLDWPGAARRLEGGSPPVVNAYAALAGLRLLSSLAPDAADAAGGAAIRIVDEKIRELTTRFLQGCVDRRFNTLTPLDAVRRGALVVIESPEAAALVSRLARRGIICSSRDTGLRVSFHAYNTEGDVDAVLEALEAEAALVARQ